MDKLPEKGTRDYALADVLSRPNTMNGLYGKLQLPLDYKDLNKKDPLFITHMADVADRAIQEALDAGKDLNNQKVQEEVQAAFYGSATGASAALVSHKFLRFLGFGKK